MEMLLLFVGLIFVGMLIGISMINSYRRNIYYHPEYPSSYARPGYYEDSSSPATRIMATFLFLLLLLTLLLFARPDSGSNQVRTVKDRSEQVINF